jgi:hypothetical protein
MHHSDGMVNDGHQGQHIKGIVNVMKGSIAQHASHDSPTRLVETIRAAARHVLVLLTELVIASDEEDTSRVQDLQGEEEEHSLHLMRAAINPIAIEDI